MMIHFSHSHRPMARALLVAAIAAALLTSTTATAGSPCHHCPPDDTIGGESQDLDGQWFQNRLYIAEGQSELNEAIENYDGYDPAVRLAQFILWLAEQLGPGGSNASSGGGSGGDGPSPNNLELWPVDEAGATQANGRIVIPMDEGGYISHGQRAVAFENGQALPLVINLSLARNTEYGGYVMLYHADGADPVAYVGFPFIDDRVAWEYQPVGLRTNDLESLEQVRRYMPRFSVKQD